MKETILLFSSDKKYIDINEKKKKILIGVGSSSETWIILISDFEVEFLYIFTEKNQ